MSKATAASDIPTERRKEIFVALVHEQDQATSPVPESRRTVARKFSVTEEQVNDIEREGLDEEWPPLS